MPPSGCAGRPVPGSHRELRSDFLLLNVGGPLEWRPYRDVYLVDGKAVRDRDDRLTRLFAEPAATTTRAGRADRAGECPAQHRARAPEPRTRRSSRCCFCRSPSSTVSSSRSFERNTGADKHDVVLEYQRGASGPTIIRGTRQHRGDIDLPASGRFWIAAGTGRVSRRRLSCRPTDADRRSRRPIVTIRASALPCRSR